MEVKVLNNQSLFDVAIQHAGAPEAAFVLARANGLSLTDELETGAYIETPNLDVSTSNSRVYDYYSNRKLFPATGITLEDIEEGIEFWYVEYDFVVS
jgi:hypothetical protein